MSSFSWPLPDELAADLTTHALSTARIHGRLLRVQDQQDIAQDALLALLATQRKGRRIDEPLAWIVVVVRSLVVMRRRAAQRVGPAKSFSTRPALADLHDESSGTIVPTSRLDVWARLDQVLDEVSPAYTAEEKDILRGLAAGQTRLAIARELEKSVDTLEAVVKKLLERLRFSVGLDNNISS